MEGFSIRFLTTILLLICTILVVDVGATECDYSFSCTKERFSRFTETQKSSLRQAYKLGQPSGWGKTLIALAVVESDACVNKANLSTHDFGCFHGNIKTVYARYMMSNDVEYKNHNKSYIEGWLATRLMGSMDIAAKYAIAELDWWESRRGSREHKIDEIIESYNGGYTLSPATHDFFLRVNTVYRVLRADNGEVLRVLLDEY